jgi:hypothetical protein
MISVMWRVPLGSTTNTLEATVMLLFAAAQASATCTGCVVAASSPHGFDPTTTANGSYQLVFDGLPTKPYLTREG